MTEDDSYARLPKKRAGSGALFTDPDGRVLMVEPTYKDTWEIPGGVVEEGETARAACRRECLEELGLDVATGPLLVVEHQCESGARGDSIMFVYDGGALADGAGIELQAAELRSWRFVEPADLESYTTARLARRIRYALVARRGGQTVELEKGVPTPHLERPRL